MWPSARTKSAISADAASEYFAHPVTRGEVVWAYSGVRPLFDDDASKAQEATRDYVLKLDMKPASRLCSTCSAAS